MRALDRKLLRDLRGLWVQALTISLVVGCGIASFIASISTFQSLVASRDSYYQAARFADVFGHVLRAPESLLEQVRELPGVASAEGRVVEELRVELEDFPEPVRGVFVSVQPHSSLNQLFLRTGRPIEADDEVVVSELFAEAHGLSPGDTLSAVMSGRRTTLRVAGIGTSPEYVWARDVLTADDRRYGIFWMPHRPLAAALGFEGNFNDVVVSLGPDASEPEVIDGLDRLLSPYGSFGAVGRDEQSSNRLVTQELEQLRGMALLLPIIFLGVAAFLLNVLISRVVGLQREQIAALKALGYQNLQVGAHYLMLALAMVVTGAAVGIILGAWVGDLFVGLYEPYFRFPSLRFRLDPGLIATGVLISAVAAVTGVLAAVRRAVRLAPAEAMRPEAPPQFRATFLERLGVHRLFSVSGKMVLRSLEQRPLRTALSAGAIGLATSIVVAGNGTFDSMELLFDLQFERVQKEDVAVTLAEPLSRNAVLSVASLPGVENAEGLRLIPARIRAGHLDRELQLMVLPPGLTLRRVLNREGDETALPPGLSLSRALGEILRVREGDFVEVELLEGARPRRRLKVSALVEDYLGLNAYLPEDELARLTHEEPRYTQVLLEVDRARYDELFQRLVVLPGVIAVARREVASQQFRSQVAEVFLTYQLVLAAFAAMIAVGVVYNNARIALVMRSRELATLRILGFTRREVGRILLGEQAVQVLLGIPLGLPLGKAVVLLIFTSIDPELYRFPAEVSARTFAFAALVVLLAAAASAWVVVRRAHRLDLIAVLKAPE